MALYTGGAEGTAMTRCVLEGGPCLLDVMEMLGGDAPCAAQYAGSCGG